MAHTPDYNGPQKCWIIILRLLMTQNDDINVCQFVIIYSVHSNQSSAINLNCIHSTLAVCVCVCVWLIGICTLFLRYMKLNMHRFVNVTSLNIIMNTKKHLHDVTLHWPVEIGKCMM